MLTGHSPYLVTLSVVVAILGGYTGLGLAARIAGRSGVHRRALLVGAAAFLSIGIWTMHFVGMLAAPLPADAVYLVLPTIVSYLICALVVGMSVFFVVGSRPGAIGVAVSALLLGAGICSMHYVGIHGLAGHFAIEHDSRMIVLSVLIAIAAAYGALRIFIAPQVGLRLAVAAMAFGIAVSGMHYTAMTGMQFVPPADGHDMSAMTGGLQVTPQIVSLIVACLCFLIAAGFLLFLLPEQWGQVDAAPQLIATNGMMLDAPTTNTLPVSSKVTRIPIQSGGGAQFVNVDDVRSVRADAHYTWAHDGSRERMCGWSISEAEAALDPAVFSRVHRSHIVAVPHVTLMRREGDGAVVELGGSNPHLVPVSRARVAEVKARLGLARHHPHNGNR